MKNLRSVFILMILFLPGGLLLRRYQVGCKKDPWPKKSMLGNLSTYHPADISLQYEAQQSQTIRNGTA